MKQPGDTGAVYGDIMNGWGAQGYGLGVLIEQTGQSTVPNQGRAQDLQSLRPHRPQRHVAMVNGWKAHVDGPTTSPESLAGVSAAWRCWTGAENNAAPHFAQ